MHAPVFITQFVLAAALIFTSNSSVSANMLRCAQIDPQGRFDRVLLELDYPVDRLIRVMPDQQIEILLNDTKLSPVFNVPEVPHNLALIQGLSAYADGDSQVVIRLQLRQDARPSEQLLSERPCRLAIDLTPQMIESVSPQPEWIPGDRPIPTKFAEAPGRIYLSGPILTSILVIAFLIGAAVMAFLISFLDRLGGIQKHSEISSESDLASPLDRTSELSSDLEHLKELIAGEKMQISGVPSPAAEERTRLILKLLREGREISAIAKALELTPDQVKEILNRHF